MSETSLSHEEVAVMLSKQMRAVDTGRANLDVAREQANLAGKILKLWSLDLAREMFSYQVKMASTKLLENK
jgi:hypothetical protein